MTVDKLEILLEGNAIIDFFLKEIHDLKEENKRLNNKLKQKSTVTGTIGALAPKNAKGKREL